MIGMVVGRVKIEYGSLMPQNHAPILLASASPYRRALLARILADFECLATGADESPLAGESCRDLASRLAGLKAQTAASSHPDALIIASDQVADLDGIALGKPGNHEKAVQQLLACSGRQLVFHTAVCVLPPPANPSSEANLPVHHVDRTVVRFKSLDQDLVDRYLRQDRPYDCAGSFKAESKGLILMESIENTDPTAIQGLPLIWLAQCLIDLGVPLP